MHNVEVTENNITTIDGHIQIGRCRYETGSTDIVILVISQTI